MKPKLPELLSRKIYKTGQTRGADDDVIFQNRVGRNSTVLIPYQYTTPIVYPDEKKSFENGFIVLISPEVYFNDKDINNSLKRRNLFLGINCLVFYETRQDWDKYNPEELNWEPAQSRKSPLGGNYVARVPATTAIKSGGKIIRGFTTTRNKGAGIRLYEYANSEIIKKVRIQLEAVYWLTYNSVEVAVQNKMIIKHAETRRNEALKECEQYGLLDYPLLKKVRIIDRDNQTSCPLCRDKLSATGFFSRMQQAEGRDVPDLTVTEINIFHIDELRYGVFNHRPYNLGWGHHHCNVVTRDIGISKTLEWMQQVLERNRDY